MLRAAAVPRVLRLPRPPRAAVWAAMVLLGLGGAFLWLRDSELVAVEDVIVTGVSGPEAQRLRELLADAARDMTTLHVREDQLRLIAEPYPIVKSISATADFPHGLTIEVTQREPVAMIVVGGARTPVAEDGTLLRGAAPRRVPVVPMHVPPTGDRVADGRALRAIAALAIAPGPLRLRVEKLSFGRHGLTLDLEAGPALRFGSLDRLEAKWASAARVLADKSSAGATYIDVRYPERPAAGGLEDPATQTDPRAADVVPPPPGTATTQPAAPATPLATPPAVVPQATPPP